MSLSNSTYIVGAGFSKFAGLPLMNDFFFKAKDLYPKLTEEEKKIFDKIFDFYKEYSEMKNYMNMDLMNIEELLSIIEMNQFLNDSRIKRYYTNFLKIVIENYSVINNQRNNPKSDSKKPIYLQFINHVYGFKLTNTNGIETMKSTLPQNGIISLNYDLIIENTILNNDLYNLDFSYGLSDKYIDPTYRQAGNRVKLAKIHGSINFKYGNSYLIVPPTWNKTSETKIRSVWKLANDLITNSENLIFIGYSLPKTDLYVKYLLINGIQNCKNLKRIIVICHESDNSVRMRYEDFFESYFREKSFIYIPKKFEEINWGSFSYTERINGKLTQFDIVQE